MRRSDICGVGVDIEDIKRFKKILKNIHFQRKVFTDREINYCNNFPVPEAHFAVRFAGKEATLKALGPNRQGLMPNEIEILNRRSGEPFINMKRQKLKRDFRYLISLSHSATRAVAFSIIRKKSRP
jgi:holo-[acyl-carrier protein] synthase